MPNSDITKRRATYQKYARTLGGRYSGLKRNATRRKIAVSLTFDEYERLVRTGVCYYCNAKLPAAGGGLDRLDNQLPYTYDNCVPCCQQCNNMKGRIEACGFTYPRTVELLRELISSRAVDGISKAQHSPESGVCK